MRTLVVSDLHLGSRTGRDVLRAPEPLAALEAAIGAVDRLVLLGDTVELLEGRMTEAITLALPVLRRIGAAMGGRGPIDLVIGNHDHVLIRPWIRARRLEGKVLHAADRVPRDVSEGLARVVGVLEEGGSTVRVRYPGMWLDRTTYLHHGHYLDSFLLPGPLKRRAEAQMEAAPAGGEALERAGGPSLAAAQSAMAGDLPDHLDAQLHRWVGLTRAVGLAAAPLSGRGVGGRLAPLSAGALGYQFRRSGLPAMGRVAEVLGVAQRAQHVVFGHVHRRGPMLEDDLGEWRGGGRPVPEPVADPVAAAAEDDAPDAAAPRPPGWRARRSARAPVPTPAPGADAHDHRGAFSLVNTGCWVYEPLVLAGAAPPHPYWPGGAVVHVDGAPPVPVSLLDGLPHEALRVERDRG